MEILVRLAIIEQSSLHPLVASLAAREVYDALAEHVCHGYITIRCVFASWWCWQNFVPQRGLNILTNLPSKAWTFQDKLL